MTSTRFSSVRAAALSSAASIALLAGVAQAQAAASKGLEDPAPFSIPAQNLESALNQFAEQSDMMLLFSPEVVRVSQGNAVSGTITPLAALDGMLAGSGLGYAVTDSGAILVGDASEVAARAAGESESPQGLTVLAQAETGTSTGRTREKIIVTGQKREEYIQDVPIAISAFSQEDLTTSQIAGGPDLITQIPNFTFTKTNFTGYSIQIRGIGTQAISATTDAAVTVSLNNTSFIRNRFFEQEFYDMERVEVLRGPQGTLYGRNATAGVVNLISAKPMLGEDEARGSIDLGNFESRRLEAMVNIPLVGDQLALRAAGAWTVRDGYATNEITGSPIDGRDLWSTRLSLRFAPSDAIDANLIWEHFEEDDDRLRSGKQLCKRDDRSEIGGIPTPSGTNGYQALYNQGCLPASLYADESFQAPNGFSLPYYHPLGQIFLPTKSGFDPYASTTQSRDLRVIESTVDPHYGAETDLFELQLSFDVADGLTLDSETSYLVDDLFSTQDFNRFNTEAGAWEQPNPDGSVGGAAGDRPGVMEEGPLGGIFCDPQIGCADRLVAVDLSTAQSRQFSQEFRLSSQYAGPFNFSLGANYLRYDTEDKYYVFINSLSLYAAIQPYAGFVLIGAEDMPPWEAGVSDNSECLQQGYSPPTLDEINTFIGCVYVDPNPIGALNDLGHNYFLSRNPYKLTSYAAFGEAYYNLTDNVKLTAGLRWTHDRKFAPRRPSWVLGAGSAGYPVLENVVQEWDEPTGRLAIDWKPDLSFTDETLIYGSYAHGYKAGGANPPPAGVVSYGSFSNELYDFLAAKSVAQPKTFEPEFVDAFELGAKNTLMGGDLVLNGNLFFYDYEGYQISQIVNRSAVNLNFDAEVWGAELEATWWALENLKLTFKGGYEKTRMADGSQAIDLMDRTAGNEDWIVVRPFPSFPSNCVLPLSTAAGDGTVLRAGPGVFVNGQVGPCENAYVYGLDPVTTAPYVPNPSVFGYPGYPGFDPTVDYGANNGEGFFKDLSGNELPNAPHYTATVTADYILPLGTDWTLTFHTDLYYQSEQWARVFNEDPYDRLREYYTMNLAAILTSEDGWNVMGYIKNVTDETAITGAFLNSDDTQLTTNVFLTEPRLYGVRVTKDWTGGTFLGSLFDSGRRRDPGKPYPFEVMLGGQVQRWDTPNENLEPSFASSFSPALDIFGDQQEQDLDWGDGREIKISYRPNGGVWKASLGARFGRVNGEARGHAEEEGSTNCGLPAFYAAYCPYPEFFDVDTFYRTTTNWSDAYARNREEHTLIDFAVGRDVGVGLLGETQSFLAAGMRYAQFKSSTRTTADGVPNWYLGPGWAFKYEDNYYDRYTASIDADREFEGVGPTLSWEASHRLIGGDDTGRINLDWALTGGVLFGKQKTMIRGLEEAGYWRGDYYTNVRVLDPVYPTPIDIARSQDVSVPVADLSLGLSYSIDRMKIGAGYRWERYYDVLDGGYADEQSEDRTIDGPYFNVSIGFGG